jgi:hypothetical protein
LSFNASIEAATFQHFMSANKAFNPKSQITGLKSHEYDGIKSFSEAGES